MKSWRLNYIVGHLNCGLHNFAIYIQMLRVFDLCMPYVSGRVLDLGCGPMTMKSVFGGYATEYFGFDFSSQKQGPSADALLDLNEALPFREASADTLICLSVVEHLKAPKAFLLEAYRVLKPGGFLLIEVPFMWHEHESPRDFTRLTRYGLEEWLTEAGFRVQTLQPTTGFWVMWFLKLNYQLKRLVRGPAPIRVLLRLVASVFWIANQILAMSLDKVWPQSEQDVAGYFAIVEKVES